MASRATRAAAAGRDGHVALASQTAEAGDTVNDPVVEPRLGHHPLDGAAGAFGNAAFQRGQAVEFVQNCTGSRRTPVTMWRSQSCSSART